MADRALHLVFWRVFILTILSNTCLNLCPNSDVSYGRYNFKLECSSNYTGMCDDGGSVGVGVKLAIVRCGQFPDDLSSFANVRFQ